MTVKGERGGGGGALPFPPPSPSHLWLGGTHNAIYYSFIKMNYAFNFNDID